MENSLYREFLEIFVDRVREARLGEVDSEGVTPLKPREDAFTTVFLEDMQDVGLIADANILYFEKKLGRANGKLNGFFLADDNAEITLITTINGGFPSADLKSIPGSEVGKAIRAALQVFRSAKAPIYEDMEKSCPERDMMQQLHDAHPQIGSIRVVVLINGEGSKLSEFEQPEDLPPAIADVWDLERLFRATSAGLSYESVRIDVEGKLGYALPCLQAPESAGDHRCYFAIIPGSLLHDLYHEHGPRLLELNVRSFLQAKGKVNRGIRDTLHEQPGYFLAYNNGISATVEDLDLIQSLEGGSAIRSVKGLQIVNGGQTVASIHRAKDRDKIDLSKVFVQAKITKVDAEQVDHLVPMISRYSNTQNKVNETDFSANHPFHVRIQQLAERVWAPGETTRWFYERARGQWEVARVRAGTQAKIRAFDAQTPRQQRIDKNLLAKAVMAWGEEPHVVSLGGQKCFVAFMSRLASMCSNWEPDDAYYRDLIAKIILFKRAEKLARQIGFSAYQANAVCFTVSLLAYRTGGRLNLGDIWTNQSVSQPLEATLKKWMPKVHEEIVDSAGARNVTEWCKKKECWTMIQSLDLEFALGFEEELVEGQPLPNVGRYREKDGGGTKSLTHEERERQAKVMKLGPDEWQEMIAWMVPRPEFSGFPLQICGTILGYSAAGWQQVPSPKQTAKLVGYIDAWNQSREEPNYV